LQLMQDFFYYRSINNPILTIQEKASFAYY